MRCLRKLSASTKKLGGSRMNLINDLLNLSDWNTTSNLADDVASEFGRDVDTTVSDWDRPGDSSGFGW